MNRTFLILISVSVSFFHSFSSFSQKLLIPRQNSFEGTFFNFRITEPGADITTTKLLFDSKGFLWSGTYTGLYRFDGIEYKCFSTGITGREGLAGNQVTDIFEDGEGTIWIGTFGALNRLDQTNWTFRHYFPDSVTLTNPANRIHSINEDLNGNLWLITGSDIFSFNKESGTFKKYRIDTLSYRRNTTISGNKHDFMLDSKGRIWIASAYGLYKYLPLIDSFTVFLNNSDDKTSIPCNNVTGIIQDKSGNIWISCSTGELCIIADADKGVFTRTTAQAESKEDKEPEDINTLLADRNGKIWTFGDGTFSCYDPSAKSQKRYRVPQAKEILPGCNSDRISFRDAFQDLKGDIWFLHPHEGFMFRFNPVNEDLAVFFVPNWSVFHAIMDNTGSFWFGCGDGNCWRLATFPLPFRYLPVNNRFDVNGVNVNRIAEDRNGNLWFVLSTGIYRAASPFSGDSRLNPWTFPGGDSYASCVYCSSKGDLWFGRSDGKMTRFSVNQSESKDYILPEGHTGPVTDIFEDIYGNTWFISPYALFVLPKNASSISIYNASDKKLNVLFVNGLYDVIADSKGRLWFASFGDRIHSADILNGDVQSYGTENGLDIPFGDYCTRVEEDDKGRIWLLFYSRGLYCFDPVTTKFSAIETGGTHKGRNNYFGMYYDKNEVRIAHSYGITCVNTNTFTCRHYRINQSPGNSFFFRPGDKELLYIHGWKLIRLYDNPAKNENIPPVYITEILVNNQPYCKVYPSDTETESIKKIKLNHNQNTLSFSFASLNYLFPPENRYRFYLKGIDKDTIETSSETRRTEYKDIRPGRYTFWVTGSNNDGIWNPDGKKVEIVITPPWYKSYFAYFFYFAFFIGIILLIFRWRIRYLKAEKVMLEQEVRKRTAELEMRNRQIGEMDNLKTRFFAEVSHEIRTPLSLIAGPIESLIRESEGKTDEKSLSWMEIIRRNARRLHKLVDQLLDISKIDAGMMILSLEESDIFRFLRMTVYGFLSLAEQRKIQFDIKIPDESFVTFYDRDKIEKIVSNLLANAFKFTPSGGKVTCSIKRITTDLHLKADGLEIIISDTGKGISKEMTERIFDRFYSSVGEWEKDGKGTGIGLSLTSELVGLLHGTITVESEPDKGSVFKTTIPTGKRHLADTEYRIAPPQDQEDGEIIASVITENGGESPDTSSPGKKPQILLVEDNDELRYFMKDNLSKEYHVYDSANGKSGAEIALLKIPDLVITDIMMPDMNGIDLCKILKNDEKTSHIPVIMLTARTSSDDKIMGYESGADDYVNKPFDIRELNARISNLLTQREKLRLKFGLLTGFESKGLGTESVDERFMRKLSDLVLQNIHDFEFDVGALQVKIGLSRIHLYRKLKALTGLTPHDLILKYRMKEAARLISVNSGNLTEIAMSVGFSNPSYFSKCFRDYYGVSPRDFLKQGKAQPKG